MYFRLKIQIFTSRNEQDWYYDDKGNRLHWAIDIHHLEGLRETSFLTNDLIIAGFKIRKVREPNPSEEILKSIPEMKDELRRPVFLIISAVK